MMGASGVSTSYIRTGTGDWNRVGKSSSSEEEKSLYGVMDEGSGRSGRGT